MIKFKKLSEISDIEISGVDKKSKKEENSIKLCNFTDVYYNWDLDSKDSEKFMIATASQKEIDKFSLYENDVVITKDSETREDIGISCLITENLPNVVLGYHCALIRPHKEIDGGYLNACLKTNISRKYFSNQASGSGQRYTLSVSGIGSVKIPIISLDAQKKISKFIADINRKIRINKRINDNLQQLIQSVYGYWFNQFNFPNSKGLPYALSKGSFVYNESIKRKIPKDWNVETLKCNSISHFIETGIPYFKTKNYLATANVDNFDIKDGDWITYSNRESRANMTPSIYSIWFAKMKNSIKHISIPENGNWMVEKYVLSTGFSGIQCTKFSYAYLYCFINEPFFETTKDILSHGATQQSVNNDDLNSIKIIIPPLDVLKSFAKIANPIYEKICNIIHENQILAEQRDSLLPLLMNGQVTID